MALPPEVEMIIPEMYLTQAQLDKLLVRRLQELAVTGKMDHIFNKAKLILVSETVASLLSHFSAKEIQKIMDEIVTKEALIAYCAQQLKETNEAEKELDKIAEWARTNNPT